MKNADMPAMPSVHCTNDAVTGDMIPDQWAGLTKRERAAIAMMQGILANQNYEAPRRKKLAGMAEDAVSAADALLAELDKGAT